jgi:hypothetical protein
MIEKCGVEGESVSWGGGCRKEAEAGMGIREQLFKDGCVDCVYLRLF